MTKTGCVILNYNDCDTTEKLLKKIKEYRCFEAIVVVDNNSTDNSFDRLCDSKYDDHIHILQSGKNGGYGFGNNVGIRFCKEVLSLDYCMIANPDVIFEEDFAYQLINFMDVTPDCGIVSGKQCGTYASAWKEVELIGDQIYNNMLLNKIFRPRYYPDNYFEQPICKVFAIPGCLFLARIVALYDIGLYDEDFFLFEEEKILAKKLKIKGWSNYILTQTTYIHNHSISIKKSIKKMGEAKRIVLKSNRMYLKKYCNISDAKLFFIRIYHELCIMESILYSLIKR